MDLDEKEAARIAGMLFRAHRAREQFVSPTPTGGATTADAYQVQAHYQALLQADGIGEAVGWKIALTSKAMQEFVGVSEPLAGRVYGRTVASSGATISLSDHQHLGVEFEVAVWLGEDLVGAPGSHTRESVASTISECAVAFELIEDRNADYTALDGFSVTVENCWNAGVVLGHQTRDWQAVDMVNGATRLLVNGEFEGEGRTGDALGHPFEAVAWLANLMASRGEVLSAGSFVMTGSSITTRFPAPGDNYKFEIAGLGDVSAEFV
ncbi:MAG: hydratase [Chromatiales bacterium]|jgi:2-keto-4-pentenoate hydratase|nr:hydratase [Chromatiales bacterium]